MADDKLTEQSAIAAEGIKQLVEQGRKVLSATEQVASLLNRLGPSSPAGLAFAEAASSIHAERSRLRPPVIENGVQQIQAASQVHQERQAAVSFSTAATVASIAAVTRPQPTPVEPIQAAQKPLPGQRFPPSSAIVMAAIQKAVAGGGDPVLAAREPIVGLGGPSYHGEPLPRANQGPSFQGPPLPAANQGPSYQGAPMPLGAGQGPPGMPPLPVAEAAAGGAVAARGGLGAFASSALRIGASVGIAADILKTQFYGGGSSGGGALDTWLREGARQDEYQASLSTRLRIGGTLLAEPAMGIVGGFTGAEAGDIVRHWLHSSKTSVGDGPK